MTTAIATPINQIELVPGSAIRIGGVTWESYVALLKELGDDRSTRFNCSASSAAVLSRIPTK